MDAITNKEAARKAAAALSAEAAMHQNNDIRSLPFAARKPDASYPHVSAGGQALSRRAYNRFFMKNGQSLIADSYDDLWHYAPGKSTPIFVALGWNLDSRDEKIIGFSHATFYRRSQASCLNHFAVSAMPPQPARRALIEETIDAAAQEAQLAKYLIEETQDASDFLFDEHEPAKFRNQPLAGMFAVAEPAQAAKFEQLGASVLPFSFHAPIARNEQGRTLFRDVRLLAFGALSNPEKLPTATTVKAFLADYFESRGIAKSDPRYTEALAALAKCGRKIWNKPKAAIKPRMA